MICQEAKVSLFSFVISVGIQQFGVSEYGEKLALLLSESIFSSIFAVIGFFFLILCVFLSISFKSKDFQVRFAVRTNQTHPKILVLYRSR